MHQINRPEDPMAVAVAPRFWRSRRAKVFGGVTSGLAERFGIDVTLTRVLYTVFTLMSGFFPGLFVYLLLWYILPMRED